MCIHYRFIEISIDDSEEKTNSNSEKIEKSRSIEIALNRNCKLKICNFEWHHVRNAQKHAFCDKHFAGMFLCFKRKKNLQTN